MTQYTQEQLLEFAKRMLARQEKDKARGRAYNAAVKELIAKHQGEFDKLYAQHREVPSA